MKLIYIAHPIKGDVEGNCEKVVEICKDIRKEHPDIIPVAPYLATLQYLDDSKEKDRVDGMYLNDLMLEKCCDQLWVFGTHISEGVQAEINLAEEAGIPVYYFNGTENIGLEDEE